MADILRMVLFAFCAFCAFVVAYAIVFVSISVIGDAIVDIVKDSAKAVASRRKQGDP